MSDQPKPIEEDELGSFGKSDEEGVRLTPEEWQRVRATVESRHQMRSSLRTVLDFFRIRIGEAEVKRSVEIALGRRSP